jgi:branched-chain amino acid transport system ATP-binding protein
MSLLEVKQINTFYGLSHVIFDVSFSVSAGETVAFLGRNGVGKTTLLRSIMGLTPPRSGSVMFSGEEIAGKAPFQIARRGVGFVPEDRVIFPDLTVQENLEMGKRQKSGEQTFQNAYQMFSTLRERASQLGGTLSGGEQQMLTIARALMGEPKLLLLDEPSEGLAPQIVSALGEQLARLRDQGLTILLSEQNASFALRLTHRAYLLEKGRICWHGLSADLEGKPDILKKYLGL